VTTRRRRLRASLGLLALTLLACGARLLAGDAPAEPPAVDRILLFGFGPFAGRAENASWLSVRQFSDGGEGVHSAMVPVVWGAPQSALEEATRGPGRVLIVALGEGNDRYQVETVGFNERGEYRDEAGKEPADVKVDDAGPGKILLDGPAVALAGGLGKRGFPAVVSQDAGRFLCNEMLYDLLELKAKEPRKVVGIFFVHVPILDTKFERGGEKVLNDKANCAAFGKALTASLEELYSLESSGGK
jgi:pyroglutamyl-peptidase